jgi:hypothetical protein
MPKLHTAPHQTREREKLSIIIIIEIIITNFLPEYPKTRKHLQYLDVDVEI